MHHRRSLYAAAVLLISVSCSKKDPAENEGAAKKAGEAAKVVAPVDAPKQKSVARAHLPEGCDLVATVDWQKFRQLESVKKDLEKEVASLATAPDEDAKKAAEFLKKADIDPLVDPSEVAVCLWQLERLQADGDPGFVAVVGGNFRPGAAVDALDTAAARLKNVVSRVAAAATNQPSSEPEVLEIAGVKVLRDKESGALVAQAKNGAFVLGNDRAKFEKALSPGDAHKAYKLSDEPVGLALTQSAGAFVAQMMAGSPVATAMQSFTGAHMGFNDQLVRLEAHFGEPKHASQVKLVLDSLLANVPPQVSEGTKVQVKEGVVSVEVPLPKEMVDGMLQQLPQASAPAQRPAAPPPAPPPPAAPPHP